jgi:glyoxylase-like metal-dependent hydrolase (beta-lactamase superfamily II)
MEAGKSHWPSTFFNRRGGGPFARARAVGLGSKASSWETVPIPSYLIHHPGVGPVLVDTGLHASVASNPNDNLARITSSHYSLDAGSDVPSQLRAKGITPADVAVVILTHLHEDHASAISAFPNSIFVLAAQEWEAATTGRLPSLRGYNPSHYDHAFDFNTVDFNGDAIESYGPFGRSFDLFGDGTIRLVFTPGHSAGHTSVFARLPRRDFVMAGDAAYNWAQFEGRALPTMWDDEHNWRRSLKELRAYREQYPYALIVPGHDPDFWPKLDARYEK